MIGGVPLFPGESMQHRLDGAFFKFSESEPPLHGKIFLTNYRLLFQSDDKNVLPSVLFDSFPMLISL